MKLIARNLNYVIVPMFIVFPAYLVWNAPFFALCGVCYFILLALFVPGMGEDHLNLQTKKFDPTYKVSRKHVSSNHFMRLMMLIIAFLLCMGMTYLEINSFI